MQILYVIACKFIFCYSKEYAQDGFLKMWEQYGTNVCFDNQKNLRKFIQLYLLVISVQIFKLFEFHLNGVAPKFANVCSGQYDAANQYHALFLLFRIFNSSGVRHTKISAKKASGAYLDPNQA